MYDDEHPFRTENLDYPEQVDVLTCSPWHGGSLFESKTEWICVKPDWDYVVVIDKNLLVLSWAEPTGRWH